MPSVTEGEETVTVGVSSSAPPVPVPSSVMVPRPVASAIVALVALVRSTVKVSEPSKVVSSVTLTVTVWDVTPAAKVSVPVALVKSVPSVAVADAVS